MAATHREFFRSHMTFNLTKRRSILLLIGLFLAGIGLAYVLLSQREPVYQQKTWSAWFKKLNHLPPYTLDRQIFSGDQLQTVEALRRIGADAMPLILRELHARDTPLNLRLARLAQRQSFIQWQYIPASIRRDKAMVVCGLLGPKGAPALPELTKLLGHPDAVIRTSVVATLGNIRSDAAIPVLINSAKDTNVLVRCFAMLALRKMDRTPAAVVPALIEGLNDPEVVVRLQAVIALENFADRSETVVAPLLKMLQAPDKSIRPYAARALGKCNGQTNLVVPALLKASEESDPDVRLQATVALSQLGIDLIQKPSATDPVSPKTQR